MESDGSVRAVRLGERSHELSNCFYDPAYEAVRATCFDYMVTEAERTEDAQLRLLLPQVEIAARGTSAL